MVHFLGKKHLGVHKQRNGGIGTVMSVASSDSLSLAEARDMRKSSAGGACGTRKALRSASTATKETKKKYTNDSTRKPTTTMGHTGPVDAPASNEMVPPVMNTIHNNPGQPVMILSSNSYILHQQQNRLGDEGSFLTEDWEVFDQPHGEEDQPVGNHEYHYQSPGTDPLAMTIDNVVLPHEPMNHDTNSVYCVAPSDWETPEVNLSSQSGAGSDECVNRELSSSSADSAAAPSEKETSRRKKGRFFGGKSTKNELPPKPRRQGTPQPVISVPAKQRKRNFLERSSSSSGSQVVPPPVQSITPMTVSEIDQRKDYEEDASASHAFPPTPKPVMASETLGVPGVEMKTTSQPPEIKLRMRMKPISREKQLEWLVKVHKAIANARALVPLSAPNNQDDVDSATGSYYSQGQTMPDGSLTFVGSDSRG